MALGKGLKALIPDEPSVSRDADGTPVLTVGIDRISPNPEQPRVKFDDARMEELADSIRQHGIIQPLIVRRTENGFMIVAGERRWRAARMAGLREIPVICQDLDEEAVLEIAVIENIQREDLNVIEEARGYQTLLTRFNYTQAQLARRIGKSRTALTNILRVLNLPENLQQMVLDEVLSFGCARALLALPDPALQEAAAAQIVEKKMSVREAERLVKSMMRAPKEKTEPDLFSTHLAEELGGYLECPVRIQNKKNRGKIEIAYSSLEELDAILHKIGLNREDA